MKPSFLTLMLSILPKGLLSSWVGRVVHLPLPPPFAHLSVKLFANWYHLNVAEAELPLAHYPTIGALFSRRLKRGARPLGPGPVHPVDALLTASGPIDQRTLLQGKGYTYTLEELVHTGACSAHAARRARILLKADADGPDAWPDERIAQALDVCRMTVARARQRFALRAGQFGRRRQRLRLGLGERGHRRRLEHRGRRGGRERRGRRCRYRSDS